MLTMMRARSARGVMSPNPTVEKTVMVKYSTRVWSSRSVNMAAEAWDNDKYPAAKTTRNRG